MCRTSVFHDRFSDYPTTIGRGNLSFTTINLPMLALETAIETGYYIPVPGGYRINPDYQDTPDRQKERDGLFRKRLQETCDLVASQLHDRYEMQAKTKAYQYPMLMSGMYMGSENLKRTDPVREAIKHGTLSIGFVGLAEALVALTGHHHGEDEESQKMGLGWIQLIHDACTRYSDQYDLNYSCFATPAETVAGKMERATRARFGKVMGVTDRDYFTNSNHVPVWYECTPQHKAEIEGPYHALTTAGHIFYVEADNDITKNPEYVDAVNRLAWANDMGYNAINHTNARCPECNFEYDGPLQDAPSTCPHCGAKMNILARITGYLSHCVSKWNSGKKAEFADRVVHTRHHS